jgi:signal transduction histidine kinase
MPEAAQRRAVIEKPARTIGAGLHRLVIYGGSRFGGRGDSASVDLVVAEAPWVRWWFLAPAALVIAAAFIGQRAQRKRRDAEISAVRSRIAADLHDSVGASLSRIAILSDVLTKQLQGQISGTAPSLNAIGDNARSAIDEMNDAVWFIDPKVHTVGQLLVRVRTVAAQLFDPDVTWTVDAAAPLLDIELDSDQRRNLYLLIKEALTNAHRHGQPSRVDVRLAMASTGLRVDIEDDGTPAGPSVEREGNGVANMRSRAAALGGTVVMEARTPGPGTRVVVRTDVR